MVYEEEEYREFPIIGSRVMVWALAQLHLSERDADGALVARTDQCEA